MDEEETSDAKGFDLPATNNGSLLVPTTMVILPAPPPELLLPFEIVRIQSIKGTGNLPGR